MGFNVENKATPNEDRDRWRHSNVLKVLCNAKIYLVQKCNADKHNEKLPERSQENTFLNSFAELNNNLMLLSELKAGTFL